MTSIRWFGARSRATVVVGSVDNILRHRTPTPDLHLSGRILFWLPNVYSQNIGDSAMKASNINLLAVVMGESERYLEASY